MEILRPLLEGTVTYQPTYINRAARNRVINILNKRKRQTVAQINNAKETPTESEGGILDETETEIQEETPNSGLNPTKDSILHFLECNHLDRYNFIQKSVNFIDRLYRVSLMRDNPNISMLLCLDRAVNTLSEAKHDIDNMMFRSGPDNFGIQKFRRGWGVNISRWLQDEIAILWSGRDSIRGLPLAVGFPNFVIDALPKLKADPIMLLLRVLYKIFKVGSGKQGVRDMIKKIILELKSRETTTELFKSVTESTNFETLRKKIYRKRTSHT